jgi:type VI secretion system protein ImpA
MNEQAQAHDRYFRATVGQPFDAMVAPLPGESPAGHPAGEDEDYRRIRHERTEEDATLPQGPWERELKRADWNAVGELAARALAMRSKDLQFAAWLFESLIVRTGFQALAPCLSLMEALLTGFGRGLHPQQEEHAANVWSWIANRLLPVLRKVPVTATGGDRDYAWNDWEQAQRNEQLRASLGRQRESEIEGASLGDVGAALACTPNERLAFLHRCIADGLQAMDRLAQVRDTTWDDNLPTLLPMRELLEQIDILLTGEARRRGLLSAPPPEDASAEADDDGGAHAPAVVAGSHDRREVYAALAEIAHALEVIEPHSPVPYLIRRAVAWGGLNTAQLYNEVFVRCGGQINIFELLGLSDPVAGQERAASG